MWLSLEAGEGPRALWLPLPPILSMTAPPGKSHDCVPQQSENHLVLQHCFQALAVGAVAVFLHALSKLILADPFIQIGNLLRGGNAHPLILLDHADKVGRQAQGIDRPRIYSGPAPPSLLPKAPICRPHSYFPQRLFVEK